MNKTGAILAALAISPRSNAELCEIADEIPSYVARTMAKLRQQGRVTNIAPRKGRGTRAQYALTNDGGALQRLAPSFTQLPDHIEFPFHRSSPSPRSST